jgi:hypothetical protein
MASASSQEKIDEPTRLKPYAGSNPAWSSKIFSPAPASASHGELPAGTLPRYLPRLEPRPAHSSIAVSMNVPVPQVAKSNSFTLPDDGLREETASLRVGSLMRMEMIVSSRSLR